MHIVPQFFQLVVTPFGTTIKQVRSDNAPKLAFTDFFLIEGVIY